MNDEVLTSGRSGADRLLQLEVRARKILDAIERRCLQIRSTERSARQAYFDEQSAPAVSNPGLFGEVEAEPPTLGDLNRSARQWKLWLPADLDARAALIHLLAQKYSLERGRYRKLQSVLELDSPDLQRAFVELYDKPFETIFGKVVDTAPSLDVDPQRVENVVHQEVAAEWDLLDDDLEWLTVNSGERLYNQGDRANGLYILVSGRLRLSVCDNGDERVLAEVGRGEMIGEIGALTGAARSTCATAIRDSQLIHLSTQDLQRLGETRPQMMARLVQRMAQRLRERAAPERKSGNTLMTIALLRAGKPSAREGSTFAEGPAFTGTGLEDLAYNLADALGAYGPTLLLNSEQLNRQMGPGAAQIEGDADGGWLAAYLSEQELHYRYIIYEADAGPTGWTRRCIRQADHVLILAECSDDYQPGPVEALLETEGGQTDAELVLVHPASTRRPLGTLPWLEARRLKGHYHVRRNHPQDLSRLVRRLTGRALGLVLSGGGARGYAHLGVLRAMKEAGLQVDLVGGTSMGSIIAAIYAMDLDEQDALELAKDVSSPFKLFDLTLPLVSFFKSEKLTGVLQDLFGDAQIEDLWRPYFCVSSSLTRARMQVHDHGPLWEAVRASSAIPGVFSPYLKDGELLVDGAVLNNMPVDIMKQFSNGGPIAAVNVFPEVDLVRDYHFGASVSGWEVLLRRLNPFSENVSAPLIFENLLRVIALNDVHQAKLKSRWCDLYITPKVEQYGILEFKSYKAIIDIGYRSGVEAIEAWSRGEGAPAPESPSAVDAPQTGGAQAGQTAIGFDQLVSSLDDLEGMLSRL